MDVSPGPLGWGVEDGMSPSPSSFINDEVIDAPHHNGPKEAHSHANPRVFESPVDELVLLPAVITQSEGVAYEVETEGLAGVLAQRMGTQSHHY